MCSKSANQKFWREFIELYESLPCLWKIKSEEYCNRTLKNNAYEKLVQKLKEIEEDADRDKVVRKINTFRSNYRRDLKKLKTSKKSGASGLDDKFESTLWYFDLLRFLDDQETASEERSSIKRKNELSAETRRPTSSRKPKRKRNNEEAEDLDNILKMASERLKESSNDSTVLGKSWASQYDELSHKQKIFTRKIIQDVLFYASLGQLSEDMVSSLTNVMSGSGQTFIQATTSWASSPNSN